MESLLEDLKLLVRTRHSLVTMETVEEAHAARMIREVGREMHVCVFEWSISEGLCETASGLGTGKVNGSETLVGALKYMRGNVGNHIYVLKDCLRLLADAVTERMLRDVATEYAGSARTVFMIDPAGKLPDALRALAVPYELALPDDKEILSIVRRTCRDLSIASDVQVEMTRAEFDSFLAGLKGLTRMEISQVVAECVLDDGKLSAADIGRAAEAKRRRLRQTGMVDFIPAPETLPTVGGMANLQRWLKLRAGAYTAKAAEYGLEPPKGVLMLGVQGCGKSLMARFVAAQWRMPLLRMDVGALYDKYIGNTEKNLRQALGTASAMAPCVLWIDEVEKAFASASGGSESDGGLSLRMFGQLLTWMQEHREPVFVVATANDVAVLPPELMRKGRFDEVFFVDLPDAEARADIFRIQLAKRKRDCKGFDLTALAAAADGFSGAEIEQAVVSAMYTAFSEDREVTEKDLLTEIAATHPLSVVMNEKVAALRAWADGRCVRAD